MNYECDICRASFSLKKKATFCPYCGAQIAPTMQHTLVAEATPSTTLYPLPEKEEVQFKLGQYQITGSIAKGGMGEVLTAFDPVCGRRIALKRIREDFHDHPTLHQRFLKEARITAQLTHPSIIPIYQIYPGDGQDTYYTMPYVEGRTLKQLLREVRKVEREGLKSDEVGGSIPSLIRIFLSVCQAVAYAHAYGVLHRDLKPENIIVGKYGQVVILDWGLAKVLEDHSKDPENLPIQTGADQITHVGKVVGTITYMAPERALGKPATPQTDIYSLGVILYQLLTLRYPFRRDSLKDYRKNMAQEVLHDPADVAPYREVPRILSAVAAKCLAVTPEHRYQNMDELVHDIENYIEGKAEWYEVDSLDIDNRKDWEFQENILIPENVALTRGTDLSDWVILMISKESYSENVRIETRVRMGDTGKGIGFLLSVPESSERVHPHDGYCLWLGVKDETDTRLLRSTVEVLRVPEVALKRGEWYTLRLDKVDNNIHCSINEQHQFSYISHLPLSGTHIGMVTRDTDFAITPIEISVGGQNVKVSCLAIPDAFLANKNYAAALSEYRRIGYAFAGRQEGREAKFRAGVTLMEQARNSADPKEAEELYEEALSEFSKLHRTPGAPLEYLGKGLVYQALCDYEEEAKCYELAFRRYAKHPLLPMLYELVLYRMHESSRTHPKATYHFALLVLWLLPESSITRQTERLFQNLKSFWEPLPFIKRDSSNGNFAIQLAFWLAKAHVLVEICEHEESELLRGNALFALIVLGSYKLARKHAGDDPFINLAADSYDTPIESCFEAFFGMAHTVWGIREARTFRQLLAQGLRQKKTKAVIDAIERARTDQLDDEMKLHLTCIQVWAYLLDKDWEHAGALLQTFPIELLTRETTLLHFLYGCWLSATEGPEIADIHFESVLDVANPRSWTLASHYIKGDIREGSSWLKRSFLWDRRQLYRQLSLYYHCMGDDEKALEMEKKEGQEVLDADPFSW